MIPLTGAALVAPGPEDAVIAGALATKFGQALAKFSDDVAGAVFKVFRRPAERQVDIYEVPGSGTPSGDPYVGSGLTDGNRRSFTGDGRDRTQSTLVERVPESQRRTAEQQAINDRGGVSQLDNKRNEIRESCWPNCGVDPPD